jgi:hypothetical protein
VSIYIGLALLKSQGVLGMYVFIRLAGPESEPIQDNDESSIRVPDLGPSDLSNSANDPDPNALVGLDALLQVLQNANASNAVSSPSPNNFDFSRSPSQVNENAVQVAATALNQLSQQQQEAHDGYYPFAGMMLSVRSLFPQCCTICSFVTPSRLVSRLWEPAAVIPTPLSQPEDHDVSSLLLLRQILSSLAISCHPSAMFRELLSHILIWRIAAYFRICCLVVHHLCDSLAVPTRI